MTRAVWAREAHLHGELISEYRRWKTAFHRPVNLDRSRFDFPAMWYGIIPPMLVSSHTTRLTGRSLVHLVPEGQRSTERVWSIYRWYGWIPHGASGLLIGPRHRNRHVTCGNSEYAARFWFIRSDTPPTGYERLSFNPYLVRLFCCPTEEKIYRPLHGRGSKVT